MSLIKNLSCIDDRLAVYLGRPIDTSIVEPKYPLGITQSVYGKLKQWSKEDLRYLLGLADKAMGHIRSKTIPESTEVPVNVSMRDRLRKLFDYITNEYGYDAVNTEISHSAKLSQNPFFYTSENFTYLLCLMCDGEECKAYEDSDVRWIMDQQPDDSFFSVYCVLHDMKRCGMI